MSKQTITIELDVPDGWELTGEYRPPRAGEHFVNEDDGDVSQAYFDFTGEWFIVRKLPQFPPYPEFLGGAGMAMDAAGAWYCYETEPTFSVEFKAWSSGSPYSKINPKLFPTIELPNIPHEQWTESWWPNPRYEEQ